MAKTSFKPIDVLIIGSGAAGLGLALSLDQQCAITILSKASLSTGASPRAQGGIAAVLDDNNDIEAHIQDTLIAGAGLCDEQTVRFTVTHAKQAIEWLTKQGVQFSTHNNHKDFHLTQEGGHTNRRILHAADKTGDEVISNLSQQVKKRANIICLTEHTAMDLMTENETCIGAKILDNKTNQIHFIFSKIVVLATGGASSVYLHTSNPDPSSGDGIAMAWRAGCSIANLEFNQFHPTCLYHPDANSFLISETVRGEGGILRLPNGHAFMSAYDHRAELAPRDIVARAIDAEMKKNKIDCVYLDITHLSIEKIKSHFPTIYQRCLTLNINITHQWIPVVPAAHYTCGGVSTNHHGETNIKYLFAVGEVSCTGLHGANRMASNSLLECLVFAASSARKIQKILPKIAAINPPKTNSLSSSLPRMSDEKIQSLCQDIKKIMWNLVGIVRNNQGLLSAKEIIDAIHSSIEALYTQNFPTPQLIEARNLALNAKLIIDSALKRQESRGSHFNTDYPKERARNRVTNSTTAHNA